MTQGARLLRNSQPFARELGGRIHLFAHNGMLPGIEDDELFATRRFHRVGDTDSEQAFWVQLAGISSSDGALQDVALVASVPLSRERWEPLPEGSVVALRAGRLAGIR